MCLVLQAAEVFVGLVKCAASNLIKLVLTLADGNVTEFQFVNSPSSLNLL